METTKKVFSEQWKDIPGYEGLYQASTLGRIRSYDKQVQLHHGGTYILKGKIRKLVTDGGKGYLRIRLTKDGVRVSKNVHRLIASTWIPNKHNLPQVNHINIIKDDNRVINLEWVTQSQNMKHAWENNAFKNRRVKK